MSGPPTQEKEPMLPMTVIRSPSAYVAGGALCSWDLFWFCLVPVLLVILAAGVLAGSPVVVVALLGFGAVYFAWLLVTAIFFRNSFQLWALQRPDNLLVRLLLPAVELIDSARVGDARGALHVQQKWGPNFCAAGEVWLGSYRDVAAALQNPQARTYNLGEHPLLPGNLPDETSGRCVFLLSLSDKAAAGTGDHEAFRQCVVDYIFTADATVRESDAISKGLLDNLAKDYMEMEPTAFYNSGERGNQAFWIKYLHHVLFGIDPDNATAMATLRKFTNGASPLSHYLLPTGHLLRHDGLIAKVAALYEDSPALAHFKEGDPKYNQMTKHELAALMVAIMRIAGVQGAQMYIYVATSGVTHGYIPIDTRGFWDSINLDDPVAVRGYALECARLSSPVTVSHRVSTEPFSCSISGKTYTFPRGTKIGIPICLAMVDKEHWGADAFQFNPHRPNLEAGFLGFNSVGGKHAGRECPAKDFVLRTVVKVLQTVGKKRSPERKPTPAPQPPVEKLPAQPPLYCC